VSAPAEEIHQDVLDIVGVVLGEQRVPLDKPARAQALAAMNALGYGPAYMGEQLGVSTRTVASLASVLGVPLTRGREFVDRRAVDFVLQGTPMRLRGNDMDAALAALHQRGRTVGDCARLLCTDAQTVRDHAGKLGLDLLKDPEEGCWWNRYYAIVRAERHPWRSQS
jgi:hypothetical protein